jgi:hypothetical protein
VFTRALVITFVVGSLCGASTLFASDLPEVTIESVWELARTHSPALKQARASADALKGEGLGAATLSEPSVEGKGEWPTGSSAGTKPEYEVSVAQPLRLGDLSGDRRALGAAAKELGSLHSTAEEIVLYGEIEELVAEVGALETLQGGLLKSGSRARHVLERVSNGTGLLTLQRSERALIEGEGGALIAAEVALIAQITERRAALERKIGSALPAGIVRAPVLPPPVEPSRFSAEVKDSSTGLIRRLSLQATRAERRAALSKLERGGEFSPRVIYRRSDDGTDFVGFGIEMPLPIWGASQGERLSLESERAAAAVERTFIESPAFERYLGALARAYAERRRHAELLHDSVVPALKRAADAGVNELEAGQISVGQFIALVRDLHERSIESVEAYVSAIQLYGELRLLKGDAL